MVPTLVTLNEILELHGLHIGKQNEVCEVFCPEFGLYIVVNQVYLFTTLPPISDFDSW